VVSDASLPVAARASSITGCSAPDQERLDERITGIRCDHRVDTQVKAAFVFDPQRGRRDRYPGEQRMGGYERMVEDSNFTWPKHPRMGRGLSLPRRNSKTNPALNSCREMPSAFTVFRM
jgi:hypothetical protein